MNTFRTFAGKITSRLGIDPEIFPGEAKIVMTGKNEVRITNHKGIVEYSQEKVRIKVPDGIVMIDGSQLELNIMTDDELIVSGVIGKITKPGGDLF